MFRPVKHFLLPILLLLPAAAMADTMTGDASSFNVALLLLVSIVVILAFANCLMALVVRNLVQALRDKNRGGGAVKTTVLLLLACCTAISAFAEAGEAPVAATSPYISGIPKEDFYFLTGIAGFLLVVLLAQIGIVRILTRALRGIPEKAHVPALIFRKNFLDVFNKSVALDKEDSIVLDHDYDGIRELDNDLPPWWKWGFVLTIIVAAIYLGYYHLAGGPLQIDEYNAAVARAEEEKAEYLAKSGEKIDETNVTLSLDAAVLGDSKALFANTCASCHRSDGGGNVGPNLTDDYWLHGGSVKDVFKSIKYGWRDKGMPPWDGNLSAKQIAGMASYIKSLKGTHPAGAKAPQGALFVEGGDKAIDSVSNTTEPSLNPSGTTENKNNPVGPYTNKADGKGEGTPPGKNK